MSVLKDKTILIGVTGSIAAYKAADLISQLVSKGAIVHPVMTKAGAKIIAPITLQTLARNPVSVDLWDEENDWQPGHIELADKIDLMVVAPATANTIGNFANGLAPDLLTNIYLATPAPVLIAPAMNGKMFKHPAVQANLKTLADRGVTIVDPTEGMLACGYEGVGKLATIETLVRAIEKQLG